MRDCEEAIWLIVEVKKPSTINSTATKTQIISQMLAAKIQKPHDRHFLLCSSFFQSRFMKSKKGKTSLSNVMDTNDRDIANFIWKVFKQLDPLKIFI